MSGLSGLVGNVTKAARVSGGLAKADSNRDVRKPSRQVTRSGSTLNAGGSSRSPAKRSFTKKDSTLTGDSEPSTSSTGVDSKGSTSTDSRDVGSMRAIYSEARKAMAKAKTLKEMEFEESDPDSPETSPHGSSPRLPGVTSPKKKFAMALNAVKDSAAKVHGKKSVMAIFASVVQDKRQADLVRMTAEFDEMDSTEGESKGSWADWADGMKGILSNLMLTGGAEDEENVGQAVDQTLASIIDLVRQSEANFERIKGCLRDHAQVQASMDNTLDTTMDDVEGLLARLDQETARMKSLLASLKPEVAEEMEQKLCKAPIARLKIALKESVGSRMDLLEKVPSVANAASVVVAVNRAASKDPSDPQVQPSEEEEEDWFTKSLKSSTTEEFQEPPLPRCSEMEDGIDHVIEEETDHQGSEDEAANNNDESADVGSWDVDTPEPDCDVQVRISEPVAPSLIDSIIASRKNSVEIAKADEESSNRSATLPVLNNNMLNNPVTMQRQRRLSGQSNATRSMDTDELMQSLFTPSASRRGSRFGSRVSSRRCSGEDLLKTAGRLQSKDPAELPAAEISAALEDLQRHTLPKEDEDKEKEGEKGADLPASMEHEIATIVDTHQRSRRSVNWDDQFNVISSKPTPATQEMLVVPPDPPLPPLVSPSPEPRELVPATSSSPPPEAKEEDPVSPKDRAGTPYAKSPDGTPTPPPPPAEPVGPPLRLAAASTLAFTAAQMTANTADLEFLNQEALWNSGVPQTSSRRTVLGLAAKPGTVEAISEHRKFQAAAITSGQNLTPAPKGAVPAPPKDQAMRNPTCRPFGGSPLRPSRPLTREPVSKHGNPHGNNARSDALPMGPPTSECFTDVGSSFVGPGAHRSPRVPKVVSGAFGIATPRNRRYAAAWRLNLVSVDDGRSKSRGNSRGNFVFL